MAVKVRWGRVRSVPVGHGGYGEAWSGGVCWVGVRRGMAGRLRCGVAECGLVWHGKAVGLRRGWVWRVPVR